MKVDLNSDVGESFGSFRVGMDERLFNEVTSVNLACGFHAGDFSVMEESVRLAVQKGVAIGAHPGYPDLQGFGRRAMHFTPKEVYQLVLYQLGALDAFCRVHGGIMQHVKPHGALYNEASVNVKVADAIARAVSDFDDRLILFGLSGSELSTAGERAGLCVASEVFADRTYQADGTLTARTKGDALITDAKEAAKRVIQMVTTGKTTAVDGTIIPLKADTVCIHGDGEDALLFARTLRGLLLIEGIDIRAVGEGR
ncbi:LamB/YcsF family protein [bacterium LRH843]|nr:LamB/YcsF family protein [bacterium LRH843]